MCLSLGYGFLKNTLVDKTLRKIANYDPVVSHFIKLILSRLLVFSRTLLKAKAKHMLIFCVTINRSIENLNKKPNSFFEEKSKTLIILLIIKS